MSAPAALHDAVDLLWEGTHVLEHVEAPDGSGFGLMPVMMSKQAALGVIDVLGQLSGMDCFAFLAVVDMLNGIAEDVRAGFLA